MPTSTYNMQDRLDTLGGRMKEVNCIEVKLSRVGEADLTAVDAAIGRTDSEEIYPGVAITHVRHQDFFIDRQHYGNGWADELPKVGDKVEITDVANPLLGAVYRVVSLDDNSPPYEYVTSTQRRFRLHTKQITPPTVTPPAV